MPNKRSQNKEGVAIVIDRTLKQKWKLEAQKLGLTLTDYIIQKVEINYGNENKNYNPKTDCPKGGRNGEKMAR